MRLFAAVRPPAAALDHLEGALASVGWPGTGPSAPGAVRWTARENWHVTLAFYGEVPDGAAEELAAALSETVEMHAVPTVTLRGAGVFAGRTLWVGTGGDTEGLVALCHGAREAGRDVLGRAEERERVRPHLTVGRQVPVPGGRRRRTSRGEAEGLAHALAVYSGPAWDAAEVLLVSSQPGRGAGGGPLYEDHASFPVGPY
ncbi:MAG: RNA 2',3'-cyclic phosphodiesterase [Actinomycetales bacterium]|nr:RNA 2',3'-cyclic phosphodiesterase [Actinomycetales bacterium]